MGHNRSTVIVRVPATMKLTSLTTAPRRHRSFWIVVLATGLSMTVASALLPGSPSVRSVRAFSNQTRTAGASTFHEKGCEHCHGIDGVGTDRGPDLSAVGRRWKKDHIEKQIREGGGGMPPFAEALQPDEIKNLVDYLSAKRKPFRNLPKPPVPSRPSVDDSGL